MKLNRYVCNICRGQIPTDITGDFPGLALILSLDGNGRKKLWPSNERPDDADVHSCRECETALKEYLEPYIARVYGKEIDTYDHITVTHLDGSTSSVYLSNGCKVRFVGKDPA